MNTVLTRHSYDPRQREIRRLVVAVLALLMAAIAWHSARDGLLYRAARSSVGCPGREELIAAVLRQADPKFPDDPQVWNYDLARPEWIAWSSIRDVISLEDGSQLPKWQVNVADGKLAAKGVVAGGRLSVPPADADGDGLCEVIVEIHPPRDNAPQGIVWWAVLRLGDEHNEIVWLGLVEYSIWHARGIRPKPIWRDENEDGQDELVVITVETVRTPAGGIAFKPPQAIAVFEWTSPGGILRVRSLPDDNALRTWSPEDNVPLRVDQATDLDPLVYELLPAAEMP